MKKILFILLILFCFTSCGKKNEVECHQTLDSYLEYKDVKKVENIIVGNFRSNQKIEKYMVSSKFYFDFKIKEDKFKDFVNSYLELCIDDNHICNANYQDKTFEYKIIANNLKLTNLDEEDKKYATLSDFIHSLEEHSYSCIIK